MANQNFSLSAVASVSGKHEKTIMARALALGYRTGRKGYTAEQAYNLVYYQRKPRAVHKETLEHETARLIKTMARMNERLGHKTIIAA